MEKDRQAPLVRPRRGRGRGHGGLLRMAGGGEDRAIVVLQDLQPVGDVAGVVGPL